jgi:hypothetical protein
MKAWRRCADDMGARRNLRAANSDRLSFCATFCLETMDGRSPKINQKDLYIFIDDRLTAF